MSTSKMDARSFGGRFKPPAAAQASGGFRTDRVSPEVGRAKMEAFRKIKPICVNLLGIAADPPTLHSRHAALLDTLHEALLGAPRIAFTPSMISYVLFPVTSALKHTPPSALPDRYLESVFRLLALVADIWKTVEGGLDAQAWEQLWRFTSAAVGPQVGNKGKAREIGQEAQLQAVLLLRALLEPSDGHPTELMRRLCGSAKFRLMPTLFQTITLLLETTSPMPPHRQLQLASLRLLKTCLSTYLAGQHNVLASLMPGGVSRMARLVQAEGVKMKGEVAAAVAQLLGTLVTLTLNDRDLTSLGVLRPKFDDLGQLAGEWEQTPEPVSSAPSNTALPADPFPALTSSYLEFTSTQVFNAIQPILATLVDHPSDVARQAAIELSLSLSLQCSRALSRFMPINLKTLLLLSQDPFQPVKEAAIKALGTLLGIQLQLDETLLQLLSEAMNGFPRHIKAHQDEQVDQDARLVTAIAELLGHAERASWTGVNAIADLLGPDGKIERWSWGLLNCLELGQPAGWSATAGTAARAAELGWKDGLVSAHLTDAEASVPPADFPTLHLRYVERERSTRAIRRMLISLGAAGGTRALHAVEFFAQYAKAHQQENMAEAASALWIAQHVLDGVASAQMSDEGKVDRATRKMAREITRLVITLDDEETGEDRLEEEDGLTVERDQGILTTLLDRPVRNLHASAETRRLYAQAQRTLVTCLSLSTLALTARILSSGFRPLLLTVLYEVLSHLASPQPLIAQYAETALVHIAYHTGYASPRNLVLDNVDYVINVVSQRLTYHRLSPSAPLVLIAMIRLVGAEIVPQVHDVVDEIFDALDDFHGYEVLTSSLLAVLVTLLDVMADEIQAEGPSQARLDHLREWDRIERPPDPVADFDKLFEWNTQRGRKEMNAILEKAPQVWVKEEAQEEEAEEIPPDEEVPPTRSQEVCKAILDKAVNFLSHRSPFLRARILALLARATVVLAAGNREQDLLPYIDRAWSLILLRLEDEYPYVRTQAAEVIATLCEETGDFMSRRVLDHAWPRLQRMLDKQQAADGQSALARKGAVGTDSAFTVSHRLHLAILRVAQFIAANVPVSSGLLWEMMVLFRPMLDARAHEEVQRAAVQVYEALGRRDGDALWVVLRATLGRAGRYDWLNELELKVNVDHLLEHI